MTEDGRVIIDDRDDETIVAEIAALGAAEEDAQAMVAIGRRAKPPDRVELPPP